MKCTLRVLFMMTQPEAQRPTCPTCQYDLTGLTRNICPECGTPFDLEDLKKRRGQAPMPVKGFEITRNLGLQIVAGVFMLTALSAFLPSIVVIAPLGLILTVTAILEAHSLAERLAVNRSLRQHGTPEHWRNYRLLTGLFTVLFLLIQILVIAVVAVVIGLLVDPLPH